MYSTHDRGQKSCFWRIFLFQERSTYFLVLYIWYKVQLDLYIIYPRIFFLFSLSRNICLFIKSYFYRYFDEEEEFLLSLAYCKHLRKCTWTCTCSEHIETVFIVCSLVSAGLIRSTNSSTVKLKKYSLSHTFIRTFIRSVSSRAGFDPQSYT